MAEVGRPLVSVIVPAYNASAHLRSCLDSILAQTLQLIEVIVVDDASTDATPAILTEYAGRIRVIRQARNQGVSPARNAGIEAARGRFIAFVDSDDLVGPTMYAELVAAAEEFDSEIVACGITVTRAGNDDVNEPFPWPSRVRISPERVRDRLHSAWADRALWYPFRSVYASELMERLALRFDPGIRKGEDSLFNLQALAAARACAVIPTFGYTYRKHETSATARPLADEAANLQRLGERVLDVYSDLSFDERARADFLDHVRRSDLPTSIVRLASHPDAVEQVRALIRTPTARLALRQRRHGPPFLPARVALLLTLARLGWVPLLVIILRQFGRH